MAQAQLREDQEESLFSIKICPDLTLTKSAGQTDVRITKKRQKIVLSLVEWVKLVGSAGRLEVVAALLEEKK